MPSNMATVFDAEKEQSLFPTFVRNTIIKSFERSYRILTKRLDLKILILPSLYSRVLTGNYIFDH